MRLSKAFFGSGLLRATAFALLLACQLPALPDAPFPPASAGEATHWNQANFRLTEDGTFEAPGAWAQPPEGTWTRVGLPHVLPRALVPDGAARRIDTAWFRFALPEYPTVPAGRLRLYVPRWQTIGFVSVYADGRLIYRSEAGPVWNGFNHPLWLPLDAAGQPRPRELLVRIDHLRGAGLGLSTVWTGDENALGTRQRWREWLQVQLPAGAAIAFLVIGLLALGAWLMRREPLDGLFFATSAVFYVRALHYHQGLGPLPVPEEWFTWMTVGSLAWLLALTYLMGMRLHSVRYARVEWPLLAVIAAFTVVTLPPLTGAPGIALLAPLAYLLMLLALVGLTALGVWAAWRARSRDGLLVAASTALSIPAGAHDWMLQNYKVDLERPYLLPYTVIAVCGVFLLVVLRRYLLALRESEQANARLEEKLREREAALEANHLRLRAIEREQVLAQERERLMQDMHDGLGSSLMSALKAVEHAGDAEIAQVLRECIEDLKLAIDSLEPVQSDLLLLLATLRFRLGSRLEQSGIRMQWDVQDVPPLPWLDAQAGLQILRILQEVLGNAARHSGTRLLAVATRAESQGVLVTVSDRGRGFDPDASAPGRGLSHVRRRAAAIGAAAHWRSSPDGTTFELMLPLVRETAAAAIARPEAA